MRVLGFLTLMKVLAVFCIVALVACVIPLDDDEQGGGDS
jgi:hypothetical protein